MSLTNWDEVLPAFDQAIEEHRKKIGNSKEVPLPFLKDVGVVELEEAQEKEEKERMKFEANRGTKSTL